MEIFISILVLGLSLSMFVLPLSKKLGLILFSCICLEPFSFSYVSFGACNKMLCLFFFLSEIKHFNWYKKYLKQFVIWKLLLFVTSAIVLLAVYSVYAHRITTLVGLIVNDLVAKYFVIAYVFVGMRKTATLRNFYNIATIAIVILTFFGLINLITKASIIADLAGKAGSEFANMERTRVVGMFSYAFDYGFCCCVLSVFALYGRFKNVISTVQFELIMLCSVIGIFICGCRSIVVVEAIMLMTYVVLMFKPVKSLKIICGLSILLILSYATIPAVQEKTATVATAFDSENEEMGESSIYMRALQFATVLYQIQGHEALGRGYRFFIEGLGFDKYGNGFRDLPSDAQTLMGLEGVAMNLLLERGYVGLLVYLMFYGGLMVFAYRRRKESRPESVCAITVLLGFICYGNMTGELSSPVITLFFAGMYLKLSVLRSSTTISKNNSATPHNKQECQALLQ